MKDVLIMSYEGNIRINNVPRNIKENDLVDIARRVIMKEENKSITTLNNVEYHVNSDIYKVYINVFGDREVEDNFEIRVDYDEVKNI